MFDFNAGSFTDVSETPTGKALWAFLNDKDVLIRLETATYLQRPALEGVQPQLLEKFGDEIRGDRWKQMMGRMTRQIMEHKGYFLDQTGVRIRIGGLFTSAARYKL
jgi:DNA-binding IclR family transcriptional regulator